MNFKIEENKLFYLSNTVRILISETILISLNIGNLENQSCWFRTQKGK